MEQHSAGADQEPKLDRHDVHDWVESILVKETGDVRDKETLQAASLLANECKRIANNEITRSLISTEGVDRVRDLMERRTLEGLAELSEGLAHYADVQAIVRDESVGQDHVIDLRAVRAGENWRAVLVDGSGAEHLYTNFRGLLIPGDEEGSQWMR